MLQTGAPWHTRVYKHATVYLDADTTRAATVDDLLEVAEDIYGTVSEALEKIGAPPLARRAGGRPTKPFICRLAGYGGGWLGANGIPSTQAELERALLDECGRQGWEYSPSSARELAAELIRSYLEAVDRLE